MARSLIGYALAILPLASDHFATLVSVSALAVPFVLRKMTLVHSTVAVCQSAMAMRFAIHPLTIIHITVCEPASPSLLNCTGHHAATPLLRVCCGLVLA